MGSLNIDASTIEAIIQFLISWGPTIFASIALIIGFLIGFSRGGRKSLILLIHAAICFAICLTIFLILVENRDFDKFLLDTTNKIMGSESGLENLLGVSPDCETIREVIIEFIPAQLSFMDGLELVAKDNGAYLLTIVDMVYRIVIALILNIIYLILIFNAYIIYLIFYSERKYRRKQNLDYQNDLRDGQYRKNRMIGGLIGFSRSFVKVTIVLSFVGSLFFVVAGGSGEEEASKPQFENETYNLVSSAYASICEYGSQGIFKVLNLVKDEENVPYYLYAADLIFQGGLKDDEIDKNVVFRDEFAAYVGFARKTYDLLVKYGSDELIPILEGKSDRDPMDVVVEIMGDIRFQREFEALILDFEKESYFINFALSLCESLIKNINDIQLLAGLPAETREILQICFSPGYLSPSIPYEAKLIADKEEDEFYEYHKEKYVLGHLTLSSLITREDITELLKALFDVIAFTNKEISEDEKTTSTLDLVSTMIGHVEKLSILSTDRANEINPVLRRLYTYLDITYLSKPFEPGSEETPEVASYQLTDNAPYSESKYNEVLWVEEIQMLINVIKHGLRIYKDNFINIGEDTEIMDVVVGLFNKENPNYNQNMESLNYVFDSLGESRILGEVLSTSYVHSLLVNVLSSVLEGFELPEDINYSHVYDANGNLVECGELYYVFSVIKKLVVNPEFMSLVGELMPNEENSETDGTEENPEVEQNADIDTEEIPNEETEEKSDLDLVFNLIGCLTAKGDDDLSVLDCVVKSKIFRAVISKILIDMSAEEGSFIYIDDSIRVKNADGQLSYMIETIELERLFNVIDDAIPLIKGVMEKFSSSQEEPQEPSVENQNETIPNEEEPKEETDIEYILGLLKDPTIKEMLDSKILEGSISVIMFSYLPEDVIVIPTAVKEKQRGVITTDTSVSEIRKLLDILTGTSIELDTLISGETLGDDILGLVTSLSENDIDILFNSDILYYTIYNFLSAEELIPDFKIVIPNTVKVNLVNDVYDSIIKREELKKLINCLLLLLPEEESEDSTEQTPDTAEGEESTEGEETTEEGSPFDFEQILVNLVLNKDLLVRNDVIVATLANALTNTSIKDNLGILTIPTTLTNAAKIEALTVNFGKDNPWYYELESLIIALDEMLEISKNEEFQMDKIESVLLDAITDLNDNSSIGGKTKLDLLFDSAIITNVLTTSIDDIIVGDLLTEEDAKSLKDVNGNYIKSEIASIIYLLNVFEISASDFTGSEVEQTSSEESSNPVLDKIKGGIGKLNETNSEGITHLKHLYKNKIFGMLLYGVVKNILDVPTDALMSNVTGKTINSIKYNETKALISCIDIFGSIDHISAEAIDLSLMRDNIDIISSSTILSSYIYGLISGTGDVLVPYYVLNQNRSSGNTYIKESEFYTLLDILTDKRVADILFESTNGKYNLTKINEIKFEAFTTDVLNDMVKSTILNVTMVNIFTSESDLSMLNLPADYSADSSELRLLAKEDNKWIINNEISNLTTVLDLLDINDISDLDSVKNKIIDFLDGDTVFALYDEERTNLKVLYDSIIIKSAISNSLDESLTKDLIDDNIRESDAVRDSQYEEIYSYDEISRFIKSIKGMGFGFSFDSTQEFDFADLNEEIYESILVKGIFTTQINNEIAKGNIGIKTHTKAYNEELRIKHRLYLYNWGEIQLLIDLLGGKSIEEFEVESLTISQIKAISFDENGEYKSYIFAATLTATAKESLVVIKEDLCDDGLITPEATRLMLEGLEVLEIHNISFEVEQMKLPSTEPELRKVAESNILNGTIAAYLSFEVDGKSYNAKLYNPSNNEDTYDLKTDFSGIPAAIVKADEFVKLGLTINGITHGKDISSIKFNMLEAIDAILEFNSQIMKNLLIDYFIVEHNISRIPTIVISEHDGIYLTNCGQTKVYSLSETDISKVLTIIGMR